MKDPTLPAREYLRSMLPLGHWQAASNAIGRDHAYIQQYIRRGVPKWLAEADRNALVQAYPDLDPERLKPPPRLAVQAKRQHVPGQSHDQADIDIQGLREIIDDPGTLKLIWACLRIVSDQEKETAFDVLTALGKVSLERASTKRAGETAGQEFLVHPYPVSVRV